MCGYGKARKVTRGEAILVSWQQTSGRWEAVRVAEGCARRGPHATVTLIDQFPGGRNTNISTYKFKIT